MHIRRDTDISQEYVRRTGSSFPSISGTLTHTWLARPRYSTAPVSTSSSSSLLSSSSSFEQSTLRYIYRGTLYALNLNARASENDRRRAGERDKRGGENDAEWARTRRGSHTGVKYRLPSVAGVADRATGAAYAGRGRHKGVDKVAIAHGTQLHAPALLPTNPR